MARRNRKSPKMAQFWTVTASVSCSDIKREPTDKWLALTPGPPVHGNNPGLGFTLRLKFRCSHRHGLLPDGHHFLHPVNEPLTRFKSFAPMRSDDFYPKGGFAYPYDAQAMHKPDGFNRPAFAHFIEKHMELMLGHPLEAFVLKGGNGCFSLGIADEPEEADGGSHSAG